MLIDKGNVLMYFRAIWLQGEKICFSTIVS